MPTPKQQRSVLQKFNGFWVIRMCAWCESNKIFPANFFVHREKFTAYFPFFYVGKFSWINSNRHSQSTMRHRMHILKNVCKLNYFKSRYQGTLLCNKKYSSAAMMISDNYSCMQVEYNGKFQLLVNNFKSSQEEHKLWIFYQLCSAEIRVRKLMFISRKNFQ
jgi:hypothetical protein